MFICKNCLSILSGKEVAYSEDDCIENFGCTVCDVTGEIEEYFGEDKNE